jgi:uncharacterized membrane protein
MTPIGKEPEMTATMDYPLTRQGVRNLDNPIAKKTSDVNVGESERTLSTVGGTVLAGIGLACGGIEGLLLIAAGGALVYRGMSGHCYAYEAAGINTAE